MANGRIDKGNAKFPSALHCKDLYKKTNCHQHKESIAQCENVFTFLC